MYVAIYNSHLKPGTEDNYKAAWKTLANYFISHRGSIGSSLHKVEDGSWLAYSRWPSKELKEKSWPTGEGIANDLPEEIQECARIIKASIDHDKLHTEKFMTLEEELTRSLSVFLASGLWLLRPSHRAVVARAWPRFLSSL